MLLQMGPLLHLGPNVITDGTFITLGSSYYTCVFYTLLTFIVLFNQHKILPLKVKNLKMGN